ncbi:hypothetical protein ERC79_19040 [Rhodococcus sp. ABRD24]|uniref:hypothetical protein n=1 Tax=Rhodococcus sp. ABRD24 TaxID=2507582 RepID=UPI00103F2721|nr:hypothetical protein [Rhodococcus sp. ABRD24]QBJ97801.1 hypothetical protein ERC79_19040 [Rhodococcus sp. ABRD24]
MSYGGFGSVRPRRDSWMVRALRALSGVVAGGVVVLTLVVIGAAFLASDRGFPGPGRESIVVHVLVSIGVVALQVVADRRRAGAAALSSVAILVFTGLLLWTQWWS